MTDYLKSVVLIIRKLGYLLRNTKDLSILKHKALHCYLRFLNPWDCLMIPRIMNSLSLHYFILSFHCSPIIPQVHDNRIDLLTKEHPIQVKEFPLLQKLKNSLKIFFFTFIK